MKTGEQTGNELDLDALESPGNIDIPVLRNVVTEDKGQEEVEEIPDEGTNPDGTETDPEDKSEGFSLQSVRAALESKYGKIELGDDVNDENFLERLVQAKAVKQERPAEIAQIEAALAKGMTLEQYIEARSFPERMLSLSDRDLVKTYIKAEYGKSDSNPDGMEDEAIDKWLNAREANGDLTIEAVKLRKEFRAQINNRGKEIPAQQGSSADTEFQERAKNDVKASVKAIIEEGKGTVFGLSLGKPEDETRFNDIARNWLIPEKQNSPSKLVKFLQSEGNLVRAAIVLDALERGDISKLVAVAKDQGKKLILGGLDIDPSKQSVKRASSPKDVDLDALARPSYVH